MITLLKIINESIRQAFQQLAGNKLRSFLSLLGITIGILCIVGVQSAVDSLEANIRGSFEKLGDDVIYIQKMPWNEDPGENWWKYMRRPNPSYNDYKAIKAKVKTAGLVDYHVFIGSKTIKYRSSSVDRATTVAVTYEFDDLFKVNYDKGRWYTPTEYHYGLNKVVIGHKIAEELFGTLDPIGKKVKLMGHKLEIIGVFEKSGKDIINVMDYDEVIIVAYELAKKIANVKAQNPFFGTAVNVKAAKGSTTEELKDELTWVLRAKRRLKPKEENNFSLNSLSILGGIMDAIFGTMSFAGWLIGIFAIFVGGFSVANIMFVSVKERTKIIGIKKAIGAKRYIILLEFLIESIILCILGGAVGLAMLYGFFKLMEGTTPFDIFLSSGNIILGLSLSIIIGVLSGFIPALQASNMDPVVAIRH